MTEDMQCAFTVPIYCAVDWKSEDGLKALQRFHTERREKAVSVTFEKSVPPMVWLDSSVFIDLAKIANDENVEPKRAKSLRRMREVVRKAVRSDLVICPEWDQALEFEGKRLEHSIRRIVSDLACGARCVPYGGVKDQQFIAGLKAYLAAADSVHIPRQIYFERDPLKSVQESKRQGYIVEVDMPKPAEWLLRADENRRKGQADVEALRSKYHAQKQTFEQQLALERIGESDVMLSMIGDYMKAVAAGTVDIWGYFGVLGFFQYQEAWRRMGGPLPELPAIYSFMRSPYYWELPLQDISCRIFADLLVRHHPVKSGDSKDVDHLSMAIPVAQYVVADKAMVDRCKRLCIDKKWSTNMYVNRTLDDLCDEIESLR